MTGISDWGRNLRDLYQNPSSWPRYQPSQKSDVFRFAQLWLTEGIPFSFREYPMVFAYGREHLGKRLGVESKNISMTGSARLGFSMKPSKFGEPYVDGSSDLDLFIVSQIWFDDLVRDFRLFVSRYRSGLELPGNAHEDKYFAQNADEAPANIAKGFIDKKRIPNRDRYKNAVAIAQGAYRFYTIVNAELPRDRAIGRVSVRVYSTWDRAMSQIGGSLIGALEEYHG
jgi:hypothetical protein